LKRTLKHLLRSAAVCFLCVMLLTSSTYAWYTENEAITKNDKPFVEIYWSDEFSSSNWHSEHRNELQAEIEPLFQVGDGLWEPGRTEVRYIELILRDKTTDTESDKKVMAYTISVDPNSIVKVGDPNLAQAIDVYFDSDVDGEISRTDFDGMSRKCTLAELSVLTGTNAPVSGTLVEDVPARIALILHMDESIDNTFNIKDLSYQFNIKFNVAAIS